MISWNALGPRVLLEDLLNFLSTQGQTIIIPPGPERYAKVFDGKNTVDFGCDESGYVTSVGLNTGSMAWPVLELLRKRYGFEFCTNEDLELRFNRGETHRPEVTDGFAFPFMFFALRDVLVATGASTRDELDAYLKWGRNALDPLALNLNDHLAESWDNLLESIAIWRKR